VRRGPIPYDLGDDCVTRSASRKILPPIPDAKRPVCVLANAAPPEKLYAGRMGNHEFLEVISRRGHEEFGTTGNAGNLSTRRRGGSMWRRSTNALTMRWPVRPSGSCWQSTSFRHCATDCVAVTKPVDPILTFRGVFPPFRIASSRARG